MLNLLTRQDPIVFLNKETQLQEYYQLTNNPQRLIIILQKCKDDYSFFSNTKQRAKEIRTIIKNLKENKTK